MASFSPVGGKRATKEYAQGPHYTNASFSVGNNFKAKQSVSGSPKTPAKASPKPNSASPVGGGSQYRNSGKAAVRAPAPSKKASPKVTAGSPVGSGNKNYSQSMPSSVPHPSMRPDTSNHNLPKSAPMPAARPGFFARAFGVGKPKMSAADFIAKVSRSK